MKKVLLGLSLVFAICSTVNAQTSAPKWPFGAADFQTPTVTTKVTAQTITVSNNLTYADLGTIDTNKVLTITIGNNSYGTAYKINKGALLYVKYVSDATARTVASTTGCSCGTYTSTASKANMISYIYDGTTFFCTGALKAAQ